MTLTPDSHFYNIPVNVNYSAVQVPTNVYDLSPPVAEAISWSEKLDETFTQNYRFELAFIFAPPPEYICRPLPLTTYSRHTHSSCSVKFVTYI